MNAKKKTRVIVEGTPAGMVARIPKIIPQRSPEGIFNRLPGGIAEDILAGICKGILHELPDGIFQLAVICAGMPTRTIVERILLRFSKVIPTEIPEGISK